MSIITIHHWNIQSQTRTRCLINGEELKLVNLLVHSIHERNEIENWRKHLFHFF